MMATEIATALASTIGLFLLWFICCFCFKDYLMDSFREQLFTLRDELFSYVVSVGMEFDDERHTLMRTFINVMIRFGHKLTFFRIVLSLVSKTKYPAMYRRDPVQRWFDLIGALPADQKQRLLEIHAKMMRAAVLQMIWRSPFLIPVWGIYRLGAVFNAAISRTLKRAAYQKIQLGLIEQQAEEQDIKTDARGQLAAV